MFSRFSKAALVVAALAATPALADQGSAYISWSKDNPLVVLSNGQSYTKVEQIIGDFVIRGRLEFDTDTVGAVKSWSAWPEMSTGYGIYQEIAGLKAYKVSKSYGGGSRPDSIDKDIEFAIPYDVVDDLAIAMCEWRANALRDQGKSDKQIFATDHEVSYEIRMGATVDSTGAGQGNQIWEGSEAFVLPIKCAKFKGAQVPQGGNGDLADAFRVLHATLKLDEQVAPNGLCRVKTVTAVRANSANGVIRYRFVHSSGQKSAVFEIKPEANKIAVISRVWDIPNTDGPEVGWLRVEGVGKTPFKTENVAYEMNCPAKAPGGLTFGN
jgi:hypothetical protein